MTDPISALTPCCGLKVHLESMDRFSKWVRRCGECGKYWNIEKAGKRRDRRWKLEWKERT